MLIRSYRNTTGMVASVDPCHNSSVFLYCFHSATLSLILSLHQSIQMYPDVHRNLDHFSQRIPKQLCLCLKFCAPSIRATFTPIALAYKKPPQRHIRYKQIGPDQIRSDPFPLAWLVFLFLTSLLFSVWSQSSMGEKNRDQNTLASAWEEQGINEESFGFERLFRASRFGKCVTNNAHAPHAQFFPLYIHNNLTMRCNRLE